MGFGDVMGRFYDFRLGVSFLFDILAVIIR